MTSKKVARGLRNNNPFNIDKSKSNDWLGEVEGDDPREETFSKPVYGVRAGFILLFNYKKKYGITTINGIFDRFAPPNENNTEEYKKFVSDFTGVDPHLTFPLENKGMAVVLARGIITMECGSCPYSDELIEEAYDMAVNR